MALPAETEDALRAFAEAGLLAGAHDESLGGLQLPHVVETAGMGFFHHASVGISGYALLTMGNANLLHAHGTPAQVDAFVRPALQGRTFSTMCLSEPDAGSSLSDITTRGARRPRRRRRPARPAFSSPAPGSPDLGRRARDGREPSCTW
ncbi:MAG: acyl-CoA dehydrogenase family protein [Polyangiales bacterium]